MAKFIVHFVMLVLSIACIMSLGMDARRKIQYDGDNFDDIMWFAVKISGLLFFLSMFFFSSVLQEALKR